MPETVWSRISAPALRELAARDAIVLLPIASTEQHGPHLPTGVDDILCSAVCRRTAEMLSPDVHAVVAPCVWSGLAEHHVPFGGTFTLRLRTLHLLLEDLCQSILRAGFRRILLVNGHGGNISGLASLAVELTRDLGVPIATTTYFAEASDVIRDVLEKQPDVMHACEGETSMMMALEPELVNTSVLGEAHGPAFDIMASLAPTLRRFRTFAELTPSGVMGDARTASAEKGAAIFEASAQRLAQRLRANEPWNTLVSQGSKNDGSKVDSDRPGVAAG